MNRSIQFALALLAIAACKKSDTTDTAAAPPPDSLVVADSFATPESVLYDSVMDVYVVANINGSPATKDDNGFLSRVGTDGRVVELKWVDGASDSVTLNAPKGMGIRGDTLFVSDIDEVRMFDRTTGRPLGSLPVRGATFLNDLDVGPDGTVYVTDSGLRPDFSPSGTDAVYARTTSGWRALIRNRSLGAPNGVLSDGGSGVYVVTFGSGEYYHVTGTGERHNLPKPAKGQLDGLIMQRNGRVVASSWADSSLIALDSGATEWRTLIAGLPTPADIGHDTRRDRVLVPIFQGNRIEVRKLR